MKKMLVVAALAALSPVAVSAQASSTQGRIAIVDAQQVVAASPGAREAQQTLEREVGPMRQQVQQMETELDSLASVYDQRQVMLSPEAKRQMQETIRTKQQEYMQRGQQLQQQAAKRQQELLQPIMARIQQVVEQLREERGYALVIDASEGGVITAAPGVDITQDVITRLNPSGTAQAPSAKP